MDSDGNCLDKSFYVACKKSDGSLMYECDFSDGYRSPGEACSQTSLPSCPDDIDVSRFNTCPSVTTLSKKQNSHNERKFLYKLILLHVFIISILLFMKN